MEEGIFAELESFYRSQLGEIIENYIKDAIASWWGKSKNEKILGIGYTRNILKNFVGFHNEVFSCEIDKICKEKLSLDGVSYSYIGNPFNLPHKNNSFNKVVTYHCFEYIDRYDKFIDEIWRILKPGGKAIIIVPNKLYFWPKSYSTPFNNSKSFLFTEIANIFGDSFFEVTKFGSVLFSNPNLYNFVPGITVFFENVGQKFFHPFGRLLMFEVTKSLSEKKATKASSISANLAFLN